MTLTIISNYCRRLFTVSVLSVFFVMPLAAQEASVPGQVRISCSLSETRITTDEVTRLTVAVIWDGDKAQYDFTWPGPPASDKLEVTGTASSSGRVVENGKTLARKEFTYTLKPLTTGKAAIEPFTVRYKDRTTGVEGSERSGYLEIIVARPAPESRAVRNAVLILLVLAGIAGLVFGYLKLIRKKDGSGPVKEPDTEVSPADQAREKLKEADRLKIAGETKEYCLEVTRIVKVFLKAEFGIAGGRMLTAEIVQALRDKKADEAAVARIQSVLELADQLKFASGSLETGRVEQLGVLAAGLLEATDGS